MIQLNHSQVLFIYKLRFRSENPCNIMFSSMDTEERQQTLVVKTF